MHSEPKCFQGVYAGPLTMEALDYNGHMILGVPVSDAAEDGSCFFVTMDEHMQLSIAPVIASSVRSYDPEEIPATPECTPEEIENTRRNLEEALRRKMRRNVFSVIDLENCGTLMNALAEVIELQDRVLAAQAAGASPCAGTADAENEVQP